MTRHIRVLEQLALMGSNLYAHGPCIRWKIDLGELEERPSNSIPDFVPRLKALIPSLEEHRCSEGVRGGFFLRLDEGTWMGHVMEHIALELQTLAGSNVGFGRARSAGPPGVYHVVYECEERESGIAAGQLAIEIIEGLVDGEPLDFPELLEDFKRLHYRSTLGPSTKAIVAAARRRGIPTMRMDEQNLVQLGYGSRAKRIRATTTSKTSHHGVEIAADKALTKLFLGTRGIPVPQGRSCRDFETALEIARGIGWPVVVKPLDASKGRGIHTNIQDEESLRIAFENAKEYRATVIVEKFVRGSDFRLLVIGGKFVAAAQRLPAHVIGDGRQTIEQLVEAENRNPLRGHGHENLLTRITIDSSTHRLLGLRGLSLSSVPADGERVDLKTTANLSTGGVAIDVTDHVHPSNIEMAERISCLVDLDIAGIDVVADTIEVPIEETGGAIVEVNAAPGFRMHLSPTQGTPRPVGDAVVDMLFPAGTPSRIPLITVTGTNGKTTTARLCAHIARQAGFRVGLTTTDGVYVQNKLIVKGDTTGPRSAAIVLQDPTVDFAVLETARGGILRSGLGFDRSNVAIVTNIAEDHMGLRGVNTLEDLARVKAVTVEAVADDGVAVLNAEDAMMPFIRRRASCDVALFAVDGKNEVLRKHIDRGGLAATVESGEIVIYDRGMRVNVGPIHQVPITFEGRAAFNIANTLAVTLAAHAMKLGLDAIRVGLTTFFPSASQVPGRTNMIAFNGFTVLVDYAHNPHAMQAITGLVRELKKGRAIGVVTVPGDRRDVDIRNVATALAGAFDEIILREDLDLRGRPPGEVNGLIRETLMSSGVSPDRIHTIPDEREAFRKALALARERDLIVHFADHVDEVLRILDEEKQAYLATHRQVSAATLSHAG